MSTATAESRRNPNKRRLELKLKRSETGQVFLFAAKWTNLSGDSKSGELGRDWKRTPSLPGARETWALLFVCYWLHEIKNPDQWCEFRFRDRESLSIGGLLTNTKSGYWCTDLFGQGEIQTVCNQSGDEILIDSLTPYQVEISLDGESLSSLAAAGDFDTLRVVVRTLAGNQQADFYEDRYLQPFQKAKTVAPSEHPVEDLKAVSTEGMISSSGRSTPELPHTNQPANGLETGVAPVPDKESEKVDSTLIDHDGERCLVAVRVNGKIRGTGFVVGQGIVVTCAHVVLPNNKMPDDLTSPVQYSIEYLALMRSGAQNDPVSGAPAVQEVQLDRQHFSRHSENDVAFLTWNGRVPEGVKIGRLSTLGNLGGRRCRVKGFAEFAPFEILTAVVEVAATGGKRDAEPILNLAKANSVLSGHSGGPLFDCDTNAIVGMVSAVNGAPDGVSWHGTEYGFVVRCATIRAIWPELFRDDRAAEIDQHLTTAALNLRTAMKDCLLRHPRAQSAIAAHFQRGDLAHSVEETALKLVDAILTDPPQGVVPALCLADNHLRVGPTADVDAANGLIEFYCLFMPGIVSRRSKDDVRLMLEQVRGVHRGPVIVPTSSKTILALYLAAMDGVAVKLNQRSAEEAEPPGQHLLDDIPEAGFQNADVNKSVILTHLIQHLGGPSFPPGFQNWTEPERIDEVNEKLRLWHETKQTKAIVVSRQLSEAQQESLREMLLYVAIVQLAQIRGHHRELISPFTQANFPLPS